MKGNKLIGCMMTVSVCLAGSVAWCRNGGEASNEYENIIHPGPADGSGIWNRNARWFMYAPAFAFKRVEGAASYRFTVIDDLHESRTFDADRPTAALVPVWSKLPTGMVTVTCEGVDASGKVIARAGERTFWKAAGFREGAYPKAAKSYRDAALGVYRYIFNMKETQYLVKNGKLDPSYELNTYASKMCTSLIMGMIRYGELEPDIRERALAVARAAAEHLIAKSEPADAPLAYFPPTYDGRGEKANHYVAEKFKGQIMLCYPASVALAFLDLAKATGEVRYREAAERIAGTFLKLQGEDGTWYLKMWTKDGKPVCQNRLVPIESVTPLFERLFEETGDARYRTAADRSFASLEVRLADWNWEGQFEDVAPTARYENLTKHSACATAIYLAKRYPNDPVRRAQVRELLRFAEDQFVIWEPPFKNGRKPANQKWWAGCCDDWITPCALEQYRCYAPIDASAAKLIRTYLAAYRLEGRSEDLAKARALGDTATRVQFPNGRLPTWWWPSRAKVVEADWINCMMATAAALLQLDEMTGGSEFASGGDGMPKGGICAHRGDRATFPENTVPAFLSAVSNGAAMVEFDVHRCKTGELIVMHDRTINRTTTGHGKWKDLTFEYLRSVDAGVKRGKQFAGIKIPTFDEAIDCFPKTGVWLNVHCGDDVTDEVARKIKAKGRLHQAFIAAGEDGVARARAAVPEIKVCLFAMPPKSWHHDWTPAERRESVAEVMAAKAEFMQPHYASFEPEELAAFHAAGGKVNYFWCNKPWKLGQLLARGVDFPLTDNLKPMVEAYRLLRGVTCVPPDPERGFTFTKDYGAAIGRLAPIGPCYRRKDRKFGGIPSIAVSPKNGRLWRTHYAGPSDSEDSNNYVVLATRTSEGEWEEVLYYDPDGDGPLRAFDPEVWIAPDGKLHWTWSECKVPLRDGNENKWPTGSRVAGTMCLREAVLDAENLPSAPYPATHTLVKSGGVMMCKPIVARDGGWLYPVAFWGDDFSSRIYRSTDGGKTLVSVGGATLPERLREYDEHNVVELKDGTLRLYMRVKRNGEWNALQADSRDGGRTWGEAKACPFPHTASRFFVRRLASGALLLVKNGPLTPTADGKDIGRVDMTAYVSDDDGVTWKGGLVLHKGACAYPDGDQASDGTIYVTFDHDRTGAQDLYDVSFTEDDVRRGTISAK